MGKRGTGTPRVAGACAPRDGPGRGNPSLAFGSESRCVGIALALHGNRSCVPHVISVFVERTPSTDRAVCNSLHRCLAQSRRHTRLGWRQLLLCFTVLFTLGRVLSVQSSRLDECVHCCLFLLRCRTWRCACMRRVSDAGHMPMSMLMIMSL